MQPDITTVLPTYRRPATLRRAIASVLAQTYPRFELWIYDDASNDETAEVVAEFQRSDSRVHYHRHERNLGLHYNFACGMERVATPLFTLLGDDDYILPNFFETAIASLGRYPEAKLFVGGTIVHEDNGIAPKMPLSSWREGIYQPPSAMLEMLREFPNWTGLVFKKEVLSEVGTLDTEFEAAVWGGDLDFELRIAARCAVAVAPTPCAVFSPGGQSSIVRCGVERLWNGGQRVMRKMQTLPDIPEQVRKDVLTLLRKYLIHEIAYRGIVTAMVGPADEAQKAREILAENGAPLAPACLTALRALSVLGLGGSMLKALRTTQRLRRAIENRRSAPLSAMLTASASPL